MCFSASASFTVSAVLASASIYTITRARKLPRYYSSTALLPLVFAIQQAFEGWLWLSLVNHDLAATRTTALGFMFFSHFFWLFWIPCTAYVFEKTASRKKVFLGITFAGGLYGASMYLPLLFNNDWLIITLVNASISYQATLIYDDFLPRIVVRILYAVLVLLPLLWSSNHYIRIFGVIIAISVVVATVFFGYAFISVWCYFAAVLSLYTVYMFTRVRSVSTI